MNDLGWLKNLRNGVHVFLQNMANQDYSYFKYSYSGDLYDQNKRWGLANVVFAAKLLYITGLLKETPASKQENIYKAIVQFTAPDGVISDALIAGKSKMTQARARADIRRAETRQSFAALSLLGKKPLSIYTKLPYTQDTVTSFLEGYDWSRPWHAGSHFSHLLFFLKQNAVFFGHKTDVAEALIDHACEWISRIQSPEDGSWYTGTEVSITERMNGAMKILTGLHAAGRYEIKHVEQLIDTALTAINDCEACENFNIVYVLYGACKNAPGYRRKDVEKFLIDRLHLYEKFYYPETGGFSFHQGHANTHLYGKEITAGKNEPDIHGTIMFVWGLTIINEMMNIGLDFRVPLN